MTISMQFGTKLINYTRQFNFSIEDFIMECFANAVSNKYPTVREDWNKIYGSIEPQNIDGLQIYVGGLQPIKQYVAN